MIRYMVLLGLLLPCFLAACSNPLLPSATPPQPGKVLYALYLRWDKQVHSLKDLAATPMTLMAEAIRSADGQKIWQASVLTGSGVLYSERSAIISAGSTIFVAVSTSQRGQKGQVIALDAQSGQMLWQTTLDGAKIWQPVAANGNLYMEVDNRVEALQGSNGKPLWSASLRAGYGPGDFVVTKSALYVAPEADFLPASQGNTYGSVILRALRLNDGTEIWHREIANTINDHLSSLVHVSIQADEQDVYVLREGHVMESHGNVFGPFPRYTLFALNAQNGSPHWSKQTQRSEEAGRQFKLALFNQVLYMVGIANPGINTLSAFQSQNGKQLWTWQTSFIINPFAPPNHIYGSSLNKNESFCSLRNSDGSKAWCASYTQAGPALFYQGEIYMYASKITYQGSSYSEQPAQILVLNERDGSLAAHYSIGDVTRMRLAGMALS